MRQVPLGTRGDRLVVLVLDQGRRADRPPWQQNFYWTLKASLRELGRDGRPTGSDVQLPGPPKVLERSYTREVAPLVRRALVVARRRPGFKPLGVPRLTYCASPSSRCGEFRTVASPAGTMLLGLRRPGATAKLLPLPRWAEYQAAVAGRQLDSGESGPVRSVSIAHVIEHALPGRRLLVVNVSSRYFGPGAEKGWTAARCRSVDTCVPPEPNGDHHVAWDIVVLLPEAVARVPGEGAARGPRRRAP